MSARKQRPSKPLSRENIVSTALGIVDSEGLNRLSMRRLGAELNVDPMAIYYHVPNKQALLDAILEAVMSDIDLSCIDEDAPIEEQLLMAANRYLDAMLAHSNALPIVLTRGPRTPAAFKPVDVMLGMFMRGGLEPYEAAVAMNTLASAVRGFAGMTGSDTSGSEDVDIEALQQMMTSGEFPALAAAASAMSGNPHEEFEAGVRAISRGFRNNPT